MLYTDGKMSKDSAKTALKEVPPMEKRSSPSTCVMIMTLRRQIEEAYAQGILPAALALSRQMDGIQLRHWQTPVSQGVTGRKS